MTSKLVALVVVEVVVLVVEVVVLVVEVVVLVVEVGLDCPSLRCWLWRGARCRAAVGKETSASVVWSLFPCTGGSSRWAGAWPRRRSGITVVGSTARPPARPHLHRRAAYSTAFAHCSKPNQTHTRQLHCFCFPLIGTSIAPWYQHQQFQSPLLKPTSQRSCLFVAD